MLSLENVKSLVDDLLPMVMTHGSFISFAGFRCNELWYLEDMEQQKQIT